MILAPNNTIIVISPVHMYSQIIKVADILNLFDCSNQYQCIG